MKCTIICGPPASSLAFPRTPHPCILHIENHPQHPSVGTVMVRAQREQTVQHPRAGGAEALLGWPPRREIPHHLGSDLVLDTGSQRSATEWSVADAFILHPSGCLQSTQ